MKYIITPFVLVSMAVIAIVGIILSPLFFFLFWAGDRREIFQ